MRFAALLPLVLFACGKSNANGMEPANNWSDDITGGVQVEKPQGAPAAAAGNDPHAGMLQQQEGDDEDEGGGEADPHAGVPGAPPMGMTETDPHAGVPGAPPINGTRTAPDNVSQLGLKAPDPARPIDPNKHLKGTIKLDPKVAANLKVGSTIFLIVKRPGPDGQPIGSPLAVDKIEWTGPGQGFELTERQAMIAGTEFTGDVVVTARYDQDGDAGSKQAGDIVGMARAKIPSDGIVISLDTLWR
jgi:hypothetical protein